MRHGAPPCGGMWGGASARGWGVVPVGVEVERGMCDARGAVSVLRPDCLPAPLSPHRTPAPTPPLCLPALLLQVTSLDLQSPRLERLRLRGCRTLANLELRCTRLEVVDIQPLSPGLPSGPALRRVTLHSHGVRRLQWSALPQLEALTLQVGVGGGGGGAVCMCMVCCAWWGAVATSFAACARV